MTIDANELEQMAKECPDECFLKGSGVLKLTDAIRKLEREVAALKAQPAPTEAAQGGKLLELFKLAIGTIAVHDQAEAERIAKMYRADMGIPSSAQGWDVDDLISSMGIEKEVAVAHAELQADPTIIPSVLAAQGEDSARLDALADEIETMESEHGRECFGKQSDFAHYAEGHENARKAAAARIREFSGAIDRARASAETGGVKS